MKKNNYIAVGVALLLCSTIVSSGLFDWLTGDDDVVPEQIPPDPITYYTGNSKTVCNGKCTTELYLNPHEYVRDGEYWVHYKNASSLQGKGYEVVVSLDNKYPVKIIDFNASAIIMDITVSQSYIGQAIPLYIKNDDKTIYSTSVFSLSATDVRANLPIKMGDVVHYGATSTKLTIANSDNYTLYQGGNDGTYQEYFGISYGGGDQYYAVVISFNTSNVPLGATINSIEFAGYVGLECEGAPECTEGELDSAADSNIGTITITNSTKSAGAHSSGIALANEIYNTSRTYGTISNAQYRNNIGCPASSEWGRIYGYCGVGQDASTYISMDSNALTDMANSLLDGNFSFGLRGGVNNYWSEDGCGLGSDCYDIRLRVNYTPDTNEPTLDLVSPVNATYPLATVSFNVSMDEAGEQCLYSLDGAVNVSMTQLSSTYHYHIYPNLTNGSHSINIYCSDLAGNWNYISQNFGVNTVPYTYIESIDIKTSNYVVVGDADSTLSSGTDYTDTQYINFTHPSHGKRLRVRAKFSDYRVDLSGLVIQADSTRTAVNLTNVPFGLAINHTLYVPNTRSNGIYICPTVNDLANLRDDCEDVVTINNSECLSGTWKSGYRCSIEGNNYVIENLTSSGSGELATYPDATIIFPDDGDSTTDNNVPINISINSSNLDTVVFDWDDTNYTIFDDDLVLMLNFNNVSSLGEDNIVVKDMSGYGNDGSVTGAYFNASGRHSGSYQGDGSGDYITVSQDSSMTIGTSDFSFSWWYKKNSSTRVMFFAYGDIYNEEGYTAEIYNNIFRFILDDDSGGQFQQTYESSVINNEHWHHVVVSADRNGLCNTYYDGVVVASDSISGESGSIFTTDHPNFEIGRQYYQPSYYYSMMGQMDELRMYKRALTKDEVQQLYMSNLEQYDTGLWTLYINQTQNSTDLLEDGTYTFQAHVTNDLGDTNNTGVYTIQVGAEDVDTCIAPSPPGNWFIDDDCTITEDYYGSNYTLWLLCPNYFRLEADVYINQTVQADGCQIERISGDIKYP